MGTLGAVLLGHLLKKRSERTPELPAAPSVPPPGQADEKRKLLKVKLRQLEQMLDLHVSWTEFEKYLDMLVTMFEGGEQDSHEYRAICERLADLRDKLVAALLELRRAAPHLESPAAEVSRAERRLLQFGFRHGADRRVLAQYDHVNEYEGVAWFEGDAPRREAHDARLVIEVACRRIRQEAEDLFEELRMPGEATPAVLLM